MASHSSWFEGYGPGGTAVLVECLTDDRQRVGARLRTVFRENGGHLGAAGSVSYLFYTVGVLIYPQATDGELLRRVALDAGAEEVVSGGGRTLEVLADPLDLEAVRTVLTQRGLPPATVEVTQRASASLALAGEAAQLMQRLLGKLGGLDGVRAVYSNAAIADDVREGL
jgi:transcriptional/translational regulatory protein YebC/TACO1